MKQWLFLILSLSCMTMAGASSADSLVLVCRLHERIDGYDAIPNQGVWKETRILIDYTNSTVSFADEPSNATGATIDWANINWKFQNNNRSDLVYAGQCSLDNPRSTPKGSARYSCQMDPYWVEAGECNPTS